MKRLKKIIYIYLFIFWGGFQVSAQQCDLLLIHGDTMITCLSPSPCITLSSTVMVGVLNETTSYQINARIPCPPPPVTGGTPTYIDADDDWSSVITLPFTFYYFGQAYNQILIGDNGVVSFETNIPGQQPNGFCAWQFNEQAPSVNLFKTTIFGAYHDLYTPAGGNIVYYVSGNFPQRKFVIDFQNVAHYHCNDLHTTQRIILHETSNVIDVEIINKPVCNSWNNGNALIALQNQNGTVAYVPPGRNTGNWGAANESWRFVPDGAPIPTTYSYQWYDNNTNTLLSTADTLQICPDTTTVYRLELEITRGNSSTLITGYHTVYVDYSHDTINLGPDIQMCIRDTLTFDATVNNATFYQWYKDGNPISGANDPILHVIEDGQYIAYAEIGMCSTSDTINVSYYEYPLIDLGDDIITCEGETITLDATPSNQNGSETYQWEKDGQIINGATFPTLDVTETGTYVATVTNAVCTNLDTIHVYFEPMPDLDLGPPQVVCSYETAVISSNILDADTYQWSVNGNIINDNTFEIELSGTGEYNVHLTMTKGPCTVADSVHVTILEPINIIADPILFGELEVNATGGLPPYQYAINEWPYQTENYFTNLPDDDYIVKIKDANDCEADTIVHVTNLIVPPYFSPNHDGTHDTWRIINSELMPQSTVYIYDRFGRLMKVMNTDLKNTWNGIYNGTAVKSDDYWYVLILSNGKIYKGHFSLIR